MSNYILTVRLDIPLEGDVIKAGEKVTVVVLKDGEFIMCHRTGWYDVSHQYFKVEEMLLLK